jgi:hypothetical protein
MERKLGEIFTYKGKTYQVVEVKADEECKGCAFEFSSCCTSLLGYCGPTHRTDGASVIFKLINNMEIKNNQLTIDIPEGMEIDLKNSDLANGIVKFKKKDITYDDILQECSTNFSGLRVRNHCLNKIIAISQLINIAKYYNGDWDPNWRSLEESKYYIYYSTRSNTYGVANTSSTKYGNIYFRLYEDAKAVINNPNFRDILDVIYKN